MQADADPLLLLMAPSRGLVRLDNSLHAQQTRYCKRRIISVPASQFHSSSSRPHSFSSNHYPRADLPAQHLACSAHPEAARQPGYDGQSDLGLPVGMVGGFRDAISPLPRNFLLGNSYPRRSCNSTNIMIMPGVWCRSD